MISQGNIEKTALGYFYDISKIPRGSGNEKGASDYLAAFGKELGLETVQDSLLNVLIRKPGTKGREGEEPVVLQAHIDMVCEKNKGVNHDFLKDPIIPVIEGDWIKARGTTLGADNGAGLAIIMAVLAAQSLSHPPVEAVFTANEEAGMTGATGFDTSLLRGGRFINLDSFEEGVITVSCAAGADVDIYIPAGRQTAPDGFTAYEIMVKGLTGGHSGIDIHRGFANANLLMGRLLNELDFMEFHLSRIDGGAQRNSIPRECSAVISFREDDLDTVKSLAARMEAEFKSGYPGDGGLYITFEKTEPVKSVVTGESFRNILTCILLTPVGVLQMSPHIEGLVQTSCNLGVVITDESGVKLSVFPRSSSRRSQAETIDRLASMADSLDARIVIANEKPPWEYRENSPLREKAAGVYKDLFGKEVLIEAIHAGLECGIFAQKMPDADIIVIGPNIRGAHSPDERMSLSSLNRICAFLPKLLSCI